MTKFAKLVLNLKNISPNTITKSVEKFIMKIYEYSEKNNIAKEYAAKALFNLAMAFETGEFSFVMIAEAYAEEVVKIAKTVKKANSILINS